MKMAGNSALRHCGYREGSSGTGAGRRTNGRLEISGESGIMLVECIVYIALWAVITGFAFAAFYRVLDNATRLRRNADAIVRALRAGEQWREAVRRASGPIKIVTFEDGVGQAWHIPQTPAEVVYVFTGSELLRRSSDESPWVEALGQVKSCALIKDAGQHVTSWRWELELQTGKKKPLTRPLFTFQAVPEFQEKP